MDKYDKHLQFLQQALPFSSQHCSDVFKLEAKRDVRKALFFMLQPSRNTDELLTDLIQSKNPTTQIESLHLLFHHYCPNSSYSAIVAKLSKGTPIKIDTISLEKLKLFRRAPRKEILARFFDAVSGADTTVVVELLRCLRPFGRELSPMWSRIDAYANSQNIAVVKAALQLLSTLPQGVQKSIMTFARYATHPELAMISLNEMQSVYDMSGQLLVRLFNPLIDAYRQLIPAQGKGNDWSQEFNLLVRVLRNNGVVLNLPDIQWGRY